MSETQNQKIETAYFAGGCFWCITPVFRNTDGVLSVKSGYSGGDEKNPSYKDVKEQRTGHRETVAVEFDPERETFRDLLDVFLAGVDPFDGEGQFIDRGHSYTLAVYYTNDAQKKTTEETLEAFAKRFGEEPKVAVEAFKFFCEAEEYHQDYDLKNPEAFEKELEESGRKDRE